MVVCVKTAHLGLSLQKLLSLKKSVLWSGIFTCTCSVLWKSYVILGASKEITKP
jgi:hypothetical protein